MITTTSRAVSVFTIQSCDYSALTLCSYIPRFLFLLTCMADTIPTVVPTMKIRQTEGKLIPNDRAKTAD